MIKTLLLLFVVVIVSGAKQSQAQTNVYQPFADSNAVWNEKNTTSTYQKYYLLGIIGDTIINALKYHKLYSHLEQYVNPPDTFITTNNASLIGGIREDSNKKIYFYCINPFWSASKDSIYLLYDFSLNVGDTINYPNYPYGYVCPYLVLDGVDSVLVNNQYRKQYNLSNGTPIEKWIEGIGSTRDLLSTILPYPTCSCIYEMICYKYSGTTYYLNPIFNYCYSYFGVNIENYYYRELISISPNPLSSYTTLQTTKPFNNATLTLYNCFGQQVKELKNISEKTITLHRDGLASGLYFLQLTQDHKTFAVEKLIITDN